MILSIQALLERNSLPVEGLPGSENSVPGELYFLRREFIAHYFPIAHLAPEHLDEVVAFARRTAADFELKLLAWHLHRWYVDDVAFKPLPDYIDCLGAETGKLYLLLALSLIPFFEERARRERFPERYALAAPSRIGASMVQREQLYGEYGLRGRSLPFLLHYRFSPAYRIGRFDFILKHPYLNHPEIFRCGDEIVVLCRENWRIGPDGLCAAPDEEKAESTRLIFEGDSVTGKPVDPATGRALPGEVTLDLRRYERLVPPDGWIAEIHIPGGGGMSEEVCRASFREAKEFFASYYPDRPLGAFMSISWIFNPYWPEYLPESNLTRLIQRTSHFPSPFNPKNGLFFVFGRDDDDYASYPRDNSLRRAMLRCLEEKGQLRGAGMFLLPDRVGAF